MTWSSTKATSVTYTCTASGTGYTGSATLAASGSATNATSAAWIGYPSTCTWRATGAGGSTTVTETMTTVAAPVVDAVTYFHNDIAGTPQLATNASGALVWKENYLPYGQRQAQAPASAGNKLWYTGRPHEEDTGLTYMGARYYMPLVGRFAGMDPVDIVSGQPHSLNRYAYANNNPYKYVDPDGRTPVLVWALRGAAVLVVAAANTTPEQRAQMARAGEQAAQSVADALGRVRNLVFNENAAGAGNPAPPVPGDLVGDQSSDSAGLTKNGKRHTSGPMTPGNGGTGDASKDFDKLTGGNSEPAGGTYPPGTLIGPNGVVLRPGQKGSGPRIDIPGNGSKPPETLHY